MTLTLTRDSLADLGFTSLTAEQASQLLAELVRTLRTVVGYRLARGAATDAIEALDALDDVREEDLRAWLEVHLPGYEHIVEAVVKELTGELHNLTSVAG